MTLHKTRKSCQTKLDLVVSSFSSYYHFVSFFKVQQLASRSEVSMMRGTVREGGKLETEKILCMALIFRGNASKIWGILGSSLSIVSHLKYSQENHKKGTHSFLFLF